METTKATTKRVIDLTLDELLNAVEYRVRAIMAGVQTQQPAEQPKRFVYGLPGLAELLGCSKTTASRLKRTGALDGAITQVGALIIIDADKALELAKAYNDKNKRTTHK